jgi:hypothetical protein
MTRDDTRRPLEAGDGGDDAPQPMSALARDALRLVSQGIVRVERDGLLIPVVVVQADTSARPEVAAWLKRGMLGIPNRARIGWSAFSETSPPLAIVEAVVAEEGASPFRFVVVLSAGTPESRQMLETIARSELLGVTDQPPMYADDNRRLLTPAVYLPIDRRPVLDFLAALE